MKLQLVDRRQQPDTELRPPRWHRSGLLWSLLEKLCVPLGAPDWTADLVLVDEDLMAQLNRRWRGRDAATDVLSFSYLEASGDGAPAVAATCNYAFSDLWLDLQTNVGSEPTVGEIVIAPRLVARRCRELEVDPVAEFALLTVHGGLHLLGWQHDAPQQRQRMRAIETDLLGRHGLQHPLMGKE